MAELHNLAENNHYRHRNLLEHHLPLFLLLAVASAPWIVLLLAVRLFIAALGDTRLLLLCIACLLLFFSLWLRYRCFVQHNCGFHCQDGEELCVVRHEPLGCVPSSHDNGSPHVVDDVVFLHGLLCGGTSWDAVAKELHAHLPEYRFVAPDLLGWGGSPWPSSPTSYTLQEHCRWLMRDVLQASTDVGTSLVSSRHPERTSKRRKIRKRRIHIVGHSMGAPIAVYLAAEICRKKDTLPFELASLCVVSMPFFFSTEQAEAELQKHVVPCFFLGWPRATWILCSLFCQQRWLWPPVLRFLPHLVARVVRVPDLYFTAIRNFFSHSCHSFTHSLRSMFQIQAEVVDAAALLKLHRVPLTILHGSRDGIVPLSCAENFARFSGGDLTVLSNAGHSIISQNVSELGQTILRSIQLSTRPYPYSS